MQDENILIRALEPEDLDYLYKWENLSPAGRPGNHDSQYGKPQTRLCQLGD